jgi:hypothetical protein
MFADIMGFYSHYAGDDESLAMKLREKLKSALEYQAGLHKGKIIKLSGRRCALQFRQCR